MNFVIGSGPAGVMAAKGLLDMGQSVTMLDIGAVLDSERAQTTDNLARQDPSQWDLAHVSRITNPLDSPERKRHFGSDYPYALGVQSGLEEHGTRCLVSQARGGLSTVWGAAVLPTPHSEMGNWPFPATALDPHYEAAGRVLSIAAGRGELEDVFPFYGEPRPAARPTSQANQLLSHCRKNSQSLADAGVRFGPSRLAVEAGSCRDCALCLSGCPYGVIWSSVGLLKELQNNPRFTYRPNVRVLSVESSVGTVTIQAVDVLDQKSVVFSGQKVFLACGPLATARIVLTSLKAYEQPFTLAFQPYFLLPAMMHEPTPAAVTERAMTLAQIFLEMSDPDISPKLVHLQVYTRNEFIADRVRRR
jgi:choline dehydrogenase-like flavoprotein